MRLPYRLARLAMLGVLAGSCNSADRSADSSAAQIPSLEPDVEIGLVEGDSAYLFGDIVSVAVDGSGRMYVGDRIGATVRAYDGSGRHLKRIAREGRGPGEIYGWPADVTVTPDGQVYVRDGSRITVFVPSEPGGIADSVAAVWTLPGYGNLSSTRSRISRSGEYLYPSYLFLNDVPPRYFYLPFRDGVPTGDTLEVPTYDGLKGLRRASYQVSANSGRLLTGLSHVPFAPLPVWDVTSAGTLLSSDGNTYAFIETDLRGDTLRTITGPEGSDIEIPAPERADSAHALAERLDTLPVPIDDVIGLGDGVREQRLPTRLPPLIGLYVSTDGSIWVERWPGEGHGQSRFYDHLDPDGRLITQIELRAPLSRDPPPFFGTDHVVGVVVDPETGVERIVRFNLSSQPARPIPG
jgi:hypothetical protein